MFEFMLKPFLECLVLVGIHSYLGLHVIRRRVIFVDLALAQIAALGTIVGGLLGLMEGTAPAMFYSLLFCLVGAALFALTRVRHDRIPQEAVIGLVYAITFALAILIVQKTEGVEHMEGILVGSLLFVKWSDIIVTAIAYCLIGIFHWIFWKKFLMISDNPEKAYEQGINVRLWDFLFYATFGFVITFSTRVAGVLLVFVFLVAPAILAVLVTKRFSKQLLVGWGSGTLVTVIGMYLSAHPSVDLPCGPTVVAFYGVMLAISAVVVYLLRAQDKKVALMRCSVGTVAVALVAIGLWGGGKVLASISDTNAASGHVHAHHHHHHDQQHAQQKNSAAPLNTTVADEQQLDPFQQLESITSQVRAGHKRALVDLIDFIENKETPEFFCQEALELLHKISGKNFPFDCAKERVSQAAMHEIRSWLLARPHSKPS